MFNIGWGEMAVIAVVTLIVVGPKELPNVLRTGAHWMRQVRKMSREFQNGVDSLVREAELDEAKKIVTSAKQGTLKRKIEAAVDPTGEMAKSLDPKQMARDANASAAKLVATPAATTPAAGEAAKPAKPAGPVVIGPAATAETRPAAVELAADTSAAAASPATPAATTADPARKTGS